MKNILDLELELNRGGWSLETQRDILEHFKGKPQRYASPGSRAITEEYKQKKE